MTIALISDIHANLPALEAVLDDIDRAVKGIELSELPNEFGAYLRTGGAGSTT
jgi:hypothetical protein